MEDALGVYRKVVAAIEDSDDVTRAVLDDAVPRLHAAADRLVDVARGREKAAEVTRNLSRDTDSSTGTARRENLRELEERIRPGRRDLRHLPRATRPQAKVVRISLDSENPARTNDLNASPKPKRQTRSLSELVSPQQDGSWKG